MLIQHKHINNRGIFYVEENDTVLAKMTYSESAPQQMIIEHTEVDEQLRGMNVGYELVHAAVEYARNHNYKVLPICPFTRKVFDKKPDFQDVLAE